MRRSFEHLQENELIATAWQALLDIRDIIGKPPADVQYLMPTDAMRLDPGPEMAPVPAPDDPAASAIHCALASASALLAITAALINRNAGASETVRAAELKELTGLSRAAGRAACQVATILVPDEKRPCTEAANKAPTSLQGADAGISMVDQAITDLLRVLRYDLRMDVAFVAEFVGGRRVFRHVDTAPGRRLIEPGNRMPSRKASASGSSMAARHS